MWFVCGACCLLVSLPSGPWSLLLSVVALFASGNYGNSYMGKDMLSVFSSFRIHRAFLSLVKVSGPKL